MRINVNYNFKFIFMLEFMLIAKGIHSKVWVSKCIASRGGGTVVYLIRAGGKLYFEAWKYFISL